MDEADVADFWRGAKQAPRRLTRAEKAFIQAAVRRTHDHWQGACDVVRMEQLLKATPSLPSNIAPAVVKVAAFRRGCAPALAFLLKKGLTFSVADERARPGRDGMYDSVHEAAWAGSTENLRILFDYGMPTPRVSQIRTPGGSIERVA